MHSRRVLSFVLIAAFIAVSLVLGSGSIPQARAAVTIYVDDNSTCVASCGGSWATAYPDLQQALTAAVSGDQIWVAAGVYYPDVNGATNSNNTSANFALKNGVSIYGGFAGTETLLNQRNFNVNASILSGDITQNDTDPNGDKIIADGAQIVGPNSPRVVTATSVTATLDGFVVTAGIPSFNGAIHTSGGTVTIRNLVSVGIGGDANANIWVSSTNFTLENAVFLHGTRGIWIDGSTSATLTNITMHGLRTGNSGSGIVAASSGPNTINNAVFVGLAGNGIICCGGITITNATFANNSSAIGGGTIRNSIVWNTASSGGTYTYSNVQGGAAGTGNINSDPQFVTTPSSGDGNWTTTADNNYGNLRLQSTSPAIDTGNNALVVAATDIAGNVRVLDGPDGDTTATVDMGAYEFIVPATAPTITSANNATFYEAVNNTFTVTATGSPSTMTYTLTGALPAGVSFNPATGVLSGTPAVGTVGSYPVTITASNGIAPDASQSFTLTVQKASYVGDPLGNKSCAKMGSTVNLKLRGMIVGRQYTYTMEVRDGSTVYMIRQFTMTFAGPAGTQTNFKWIMFPVNDVPALNGAQTYSNAWTTLPASVNLIVTSVDRTTNLRTQSVMTYTCADGLVSAPVATVTPNAAGAPYAP